MKFPIPGTVVHSVSVQQTVEYIEEVFIGEAPLRTDAMLRNLMEQVPAHGGRRIIGVIGPSQMMLYFDMGTGFSTDDLHPVYKGVTEFHTELLLQGIPNGYNVGVNEKALINRRLETILTPTHDTRKTKSIDLMHKWKASEWRNWLLYYATLCLEGIVPNSTRDSISEDNLGEAERLEGVKNTTFSKFDNGY